MQGFGVVEVGLGEIEVVSVVGCHSLDLRSVQDAINTERYLAYTEKKSKNSQNFLKFPHFEAFQLFKITIFVNHSCQL